MPDKINDLYNILIEKQKAGEVGNIPTLDEFRTKLSDSKSAKQEYESKKDRFPDIYYGNSFEEWYPTVKKKESTKPSSPSASDSQTQDLGSNGDAWPTTLKQVEETQRPEYNRLTKREVPNNNAQALISLGSDSLAVDSNDIGEILTGISDQPKDVFQMPKQVARYGKEKYTSEEMAGKVKRSEASLGYFFELEKKREKQLNQFSDKYHEIAAKKQTEIGAEIEAYSANAANEYKTKVEQFKKSLPQAKTQEELDQLNKSLEQYNQKAFGEMSKKVKAFQQAKSEQYKSFVENDVNSEWDKEANLGAKIYDEKNLSRVKGIFESNKFKELPYLDQKALVGSVWYREKLRLLKEGKTPKEIAGAKDWFYLTALGSAANNPHKKTPLSPFAIRSWAEEMSNTIGAKIEEQKKAVPENAGLDHPEVLDLQNLLLAKKNLDEINNIPDEQLGRWSQGVVSANKIPFASSIIDLSENIRLGKIAKKEKRTPSEDFLLMTKGMQNDLELSTDPGMAYKIGKATGDMLPYAGEFILTDGAFTAGRAATQAAVTEALTKRFGQWAGSKAAQYAIVKPLGVMVGALAQTAANPQMYLNNIVDRMNPRFEAVMSPKGDSVISHLDRSTQDAEQYSTGHNEDAFTASLRGFGLATAEIFTERLGEMVFNPVAKAAANKIFGSPELGKRVTLAMWLKKRGLTPEQGFMEIVTKKMAWDGIISELGEEIVNMPLSNVIADRPIGEGMDKDNLSVLAGSIITVGLATGGLGLVGKALGKKGVPIKYTENGVEKEVEVHPDLAKAISYMAKSPDYFDIEQFKNTVFENVKIEEKDRKVILDIINSIQDKADLRPFTEKNAPIFNRIEGGTEEEKSKNKNEPIDITDYQTEFDNEDNSVYTHLLPAHLSPQDELKNIEEALQSGNLNEEEVKALEGRYMEVVKVLQQPEEEKLAEQGKGESENVKIEGKGNEGNQGQNVLELTKVEAEGAKPVEEAPKPVRAWDEKLNDDTVRKVREYNSLSDAKKRGKKGQELMLTLGKRAGTHDLEISEVKGKLVVSKEGKPLKATPMATEVPEPSPEQYDFAQRAIKYGLVPSDADLGLTTADLEKGIEAVKAGKKTKEAWRVVHGLDKAKQFHGINLKGSNGKGEFVTFDDLEEVMNENWTGPALKPEEVDALAAEYDKITEQEHEEIKQLFIGDNDNGKPEEKQSRVDEGGKGEENADDKRGGTEKKVEERGSGQESEVNTSISKYGWTSEEREGKTYLKNANGKEVGYVEEKKGRATVYHLDGEKILSGKGISNVATKAVKEYWMGKEVEVQKPIVSEEGVSENTLSESDLNREIENYKLNTPLGLKKWKDQIKSKKQTISTLEKSPSNNSDLIRMHKEGLSNMEQVLDYFESKKGVKEQAKPVEVSKKTPAKEEVKPIKEQDEQGTEKGVEAIAKPVEAAVKAEPKKVSKEVGGKEVNSALDDIGDMFAEPTLQYDMFGAPDKGKSDFRKEHEERVKAAEAEIKAKQKEIDAKKKELAQRNADADARVRILSPLQGQLKVMEGEYQKLRDQDKRVKEAENAQQTLFEAKADYAKNQLQLELEFNNPQQVQISHGSPEQLLKNIEKTVQGVESHFNYADYIKEAEKIYGKQGVSDIVVKYITERSILKDFNDVGFVSLVGKKVRGPQDVADIMQIFRSPFVEHSSLLVIDNSTGLVIHNATFTLNHPALTFFPDTAQILDNLDALKIIYPNLKVFISHNHPSGNHNPSDMDIEMTKKFANQLAAAEVDFGGHVIIDTTKYTFIDNANNVSTEEYNQKPEKLFKDRFNIKRESGIHPEDVMSIAKTIYDNGGFNEMVLFLDSYSSISFASVVPEGMDIEQTAKWLENSMLSNGAGYYIVISNDRANKSKYEYNEAMDFVLMGKGGIPKSLRESFEFKVQRGIPSLLKRQITVLGSAVGEESPTYLSQAEANNELSAKAQLNSDGKQIIDGWYSRLDEAIRLKGNAQKGVEWKKWIEARANEGLFSREEVYWTGLDDYLEEHKYERLTKDQIKDFLKNNKVEIAEKVFKEGAKGSIDSQRAKVASLKLWFSERGYLPYWNDDGLTVEKTEGPIDIYLVKKAISGYEHFASSNREEDKVNLVKSLKGANLITTEYGDELEHAKDFIKRFDELEDEWMLLENPDVDYEAEGAINSTRLQYTKSGLTNKGEVAIYVDANEEENGLMVIDPNRVAPKTKGFNQGDEIHFGDVGNGKVVVWSRFGDAEIDGKKALFIDEIQSKRHEEGRDKGYSTEWIVQSSQGHPIKGAPIFKSEEEAAEWIDKNAERLTDSYGHPYYRIKQGSTPDAPFKDEAWTNLAVRRMIRYAVENGHDFITWTTGEEQNKRYSLSNIADEITYSSVGYLYLTRDGQIKNMGRFSEDELPAMIGQELTKQLLASEPDENGEKTIDAFDTEVGGEPMKKYYGSRIAGKIGDVGKAFEKAAKKYDRSASIVPVKVMGEDYWALPVTDAMRSEVMNQGIFMMEEAPEYKKQVQLSPENISKLQGLINTLFSEGHTKFEDIMGMLVDKYGAEKVNDANNSQGVSMLDGMKAVYSSMLPFLEGEEYSDFKDVKNYKTNDNSSTELGTKSDSGSTPIEKQDMPRDVQRSEQRGEERNIEPNGGEIPSGGIQPSSSVPSSGHVPVTSGKRVPRGVRGGQRGVDAGDNTSGGLEQLGLFGASGVQPKSEPRTGDEKFSDLDGSQRQYTNKLELQKEANKTKSVDIDFGDIKNVAKTLPFLMDGQIEDVWKAETRMFLDGKKGILFTNGTGSGKTLMFLGVAKRLLLAKPDAQIIIVSPLGPISQTIESAKNVLGIDISKVENSQDQGGQVTIVNYEKFYNNRALQMRVPDLVIFDESQNILGNKTGDEGLNVDAMRKLVSTPNEAFEKAAEAYVGPKPNFDLYEDKDAYARDNADWKEKVDANKEIIKASADANAKATKVMLISATPFNNERALIYGDGILFDIRQGREQEYNGRYNSADNYDQFFISNFGYRMRYNRLTQPDAHVNTDLMLRAFADRLLKEGAMSTRMIDVPFDYSREFIKVNPGVGAKIDEGMNILHDTYKFYSSAAFSYQYMAPLLEAIKSKEVAPRIREHLDLGRKVVVFHGFNSPIPQHPFGSRLLDFAKSTEDQTKIKDFWKAYPEFKNLDLGLQNPIDTFRQEFGKDVLFYNGTVKDFEREYNKGNFNSDEGAPIIVVNMAAGGAGLSLHDTTGAKPRALINLGLPTRAILALQAEGRIFRYGQQSNAVIEYPVLHTGFEMAMLGRKLAERVDATEALAMGSQSRNLKEVFRQGYINANTEKPSLEQGTGGKENDKSVMGMDPYELAKSIYWGQQKGRKNDIGKDYFATPEPIGFKMVDFADIKNGDRVLEPSAGHGAIARFVPDGTFLHLIEPSSELRAKLSINTEAERIEGVNFEDYSPVNKYNVVVMNPPFGKSGTTAVKHVAKAFEEHLYNGGRIVAIIPNGEGASKFSKWYESEEAQSAVLVAKIEMPSMFSERAGTGALTTIYVIDKIENEDQRSKSQPVIQISFADVKDNNELFDAIKDLELPKRQEVQLSEEQLAQLQKDYEEKNSAFTDHMYKAANGNDWYIARVKERIDTPIFKRVDDIAKDNKGFYMKMGGKGFGFRTELDRQNFKLQAGEYLQSLNPESDIDNMVSEAEADLNNFMRDSRSNMSANPIMTTIEFGAKLAKWMALKIAQGAKNLPALLKQLGLKMTDFARRLWIKLNDPENKYWKQPKNIVTLNQLFDFLQLRSQPYFGAVVNRSFDGATSMHQIMHNLRTEITNMDVLIIGNPQGQFTNMLEQVREATKNMMNYIQGMSYEDAMEFANDLRKDRKVAPILYDYAYTEKEKSLTMWVYGFKPIETLLKNIRSAGGVISEFENPIIGTDLYPGRVGDKARSFEEAVISSVKGVTGKPVYKPSLIERMRADKIDLGKLEGDEAGQYLAFTLKGQPLPTFPEYLHALHAKERNAEVAKRRQEAFDMRRIELENAIANGENVKLNQEKYAILMENLDAETQLMPDGGSGMTDAEADAVLDAMRLNPEQLAKYNQYVNEFRDEVVKAIQDELLRTGQVSADKMNEWNDMFPNWLHLPLEYYFDQAKGAGKASAQVRTPVKTVIGSQKRRVNPFLATIDYYSKVLRAGEMNLARQQMYGLVKKFPNENLYTIVSSVAGTYYDPDSGMIVPEMRQQPPNSIPVYRNGKIAYIQFKGANGIRLYNAWESINKTHERTLGLRMVRLFNMLLFYANIKLNPTFLATNLIRDIETAAFNTLSLDEISKAKLRGIATKDVGKYVIPAIRAAFQSSRGKVSTVNGDMLSYANKLQSEGGLSMLGNIIGGATTKDRIAEMIKMIDDVGDVERVKDAFMYFVNGLGDVQSAVENGTRLAVFRAVIKAGLSPQQAAAIAKNITVNFDRKGANAGMLNDLVWLFKPSVSGTARVAKSLNTDAGKAVAASLIGIGAMMALWNRAMCKDTWDTIDPQLKATKLIFVLDCEHVTYPQIPFAQGWSFFMYLGTLGVDAYMGNMDASEAITNTVVGGLNAANPLGNQEDMGQFLGNFTPTVVQVAGEFEQNRTWYGKRIAPEQMAFEDKIKDSELYWDETSEWAKSMATWLSENTGGNSAKNEGAIELSPSTIEYAAKKFGGGSFRDVSGFATLINDIKEHSLGKNLTKYPIVRGLVGRVSSQQVVSEMYKIYEHGEKHPITKEDVDRFEALTLMRVQQISKMDDMALQAREQERLIALDKKWANLRAKDGLSNAFPDLNMRELGKLWSAIKKTNK